MKTDRLPRWRSHVRVCLSDLPQFRLRTRPTLKALQYRVGMSKRPRARVFQPFHRGDDPAFDDRPRSGLGLYVSRKLAQVNQGSITLEGTKPGLGTCFALKLPRAKQPLNET